MLTLDVEFARHDFRLAVQAELQAPVTGIFGPSGSGKSTLFALIAGLLAPQRGRILLDSTPLVDCARGIFLPPERRQIGIVFQDARLFPHLSVQQNLLYGFRRRTAAQRHFTLPEIARMLEIEPLLERRPHQLSGGEKQRVALGRAVLFSPRLLLLDEPLASLDERLKEQILPFLRRIRDETQLPICYVSHDMREIRYLTGDIVYLRNGKFVGESAMANGAATSSAP
ncbi:MAG: molybdenum ABC transporter ATP-binding protein [Pseudomonadota bacterium]